MSAENIPVLRVRGLTKRYGKLEAARGIDFDVAPGEVFARVFSSDRILTMKLSLGRKKR